MWSDTLLWFISCFSLVYRRITVDIHWIISLFHTEIIIHPANQLSLVISRSWVFHYPSIGKLFNGKCQVMVSEATTSNPWRQNMTNSRTDITWYTFEALDEEFYFDNTKNIFQKVHLPKKERCVDRADRFRQGLTIQNSCYGLLAWGIYTWRAGIMNRMHCISSWCPLSMYEVALQ